MMNFMRRYGHYVFFIPVAIFFIDDYETNWHDHGHERMLYVVLENLAENAATYLLWFVAFTWQNRMPPHMHAECPSCHFRWMMHPKRRMLHCPHCGAPEPT